MKALILAIFLTIATTVFAEPKVNEKVLRAFDAAFPAVSQERWYEYDDYYQVYFDTDVMKCIVQYKKDGNVARATRYYGKEQVAPFLKAKLAQKYPSKSIFGVTEIQSQEELVFHFVLEDDKGWTHVKSYPTGFMVVTNQNKKAL